MNKPLNPLSLPISAAARLLTKAAGRQITQAMLEQAVEKGLRLDESGNINLVWLSAWLNQEIKHGS